MSADSYVFLVCLCKFSQVKMKIEFPTISTLLARFFFKNVKQRLRACLEIDVPPPVVCPCRRLFIISVKPHRILTCHCGRSPSPQAPLYEYRYSYEYSGYGIAVPREYSYEYSYGSS